MFSLFSVVSFSAHIQLGVPVKEPVGIYAINWVASSSFVCSKFISNIIFLSALVGVTHGPHGPHGPHGTSSLKGRVWMENLRPIFMLEFWWSRRGRVVKKSNFKSDSGWHLISWTFRNRCPISVLCLSLYPACWKMCLWLVKFLA